MLKANKKRWFESVFTVYNKNLLKRRFNSFNVSGLEKLHELKHDIPTVIYANHSSWWDGLIAYHLTRFAKLDNFVMMEEKQLENLRLFRKLGAFSVVRENPRAALESINYAVELLNENPRRTLWIYPQGEILPNDLRPIKFFNGISRIIKKTEKCRIICAAMRFEFMGNYKPEIYLQIADVGKFELTNKFDPKKFTENLALKLTENLDSLKGKIIQNETSEFQNII